MNGLAVPWRRSMCIGGADENRTRIICLEDRGFTTKLQPRVVGSRRKIYRRLLYPTRSYPENDVTEVE